MIGLGGPLRPWKERIVPVTLPASTCRMRKAGFDMLCGRAGVWATTPLPIIRRKDTESKVRFMRFICLLTPTPGPLQEISPWPRIFEVFQRAPLGVPRNLERCLNAGYLLPPL